MEEKRITFYTFLKANMSKGRDRFKRISADNKPSCFAINPFPRVPQEVCIYRVQNLDNSFVNYKVGRELKETTYFCSSKKEKKEIKWSRYRIILLFKMVILKCFCKFTFCKVPSFSNLKTLRTNFIKLGELWLILYREWTLLNSEPDWTCWD